MLGMAKDKKQTNKKVWPRQFPQKVKLRIKYNLAILLLDIYPREIKTVKNVSQGKEKYIILALETK